MSVFAVWTMAWIISWATYTPRATKMLFLKHKAVETSATTVKIVWNRLNNKTGDLIMKIEALVKKLNRAEVKHNIDKVKRVWFKILKKSLKHKHTERAQ
jgi:hypothetical protein